MEVSQNGLALITSSEGFEAVPYDDNGHMAWGYGHDALPLKTVPESVSKYEALTLLREDLAPVQNSVSKFAPLCNQNQFDALCDFAYNLGVGALREMLAHGWDQVTEQIPYWNHVNGVVNPGLTARRAREVELFNTLEA